MLRLQSKINDRKAGLSLTINTKRVNGKKERQRAFWLTNAGARKKKSNAGRKQPLSAVKRSAFNCGEQRRFQTVDGREKDAARR